MEQAFLLTMQPCSFAVASVTAEFLIIIGFLYACNDCYAVTTFEGHNHWVSEVVAGAVIGEFIGKVVYENYHERRNTSNSLKKRRRYCTQMGIGQNFGVVGPSVVISW